MTPSRNNLTPGTATESQTEGHRATGTRTPAEASQTATDHQVGANLSGQSSLSHFRLYEPSECTGKDGYPEAWHERLKHEVRVQAGHRCIRCGHPYRKGMGEWSRCDEHCTHKDGADDWRWGPQGDDEPWARYRILTVHHLDGNKGNCRWWNLVALCQRCHLTIQGKVKMERRWLHPHSDWFKPYVAGYYAWTFLGENLTREEAVERMDELLALEHRQLAIGEVA